MLQLDGSGGLTVGGGVTSNVAPITGTTTNQVVGNSAQVKQNVPVLLPDGTGGVPLWSVTVYGWGPNGKELQTWVSLQKPGTAWAKWVRTPTGGQTPRIVLDPSSLGSGARFTIKGNQLQILNADGSTGAIPQGFDWGTVARFYDSRDGTGAAAGFGAPGQEYEQATSDAEGKVSFYKAPIKQPFDVYGSKITRLLDEHPKVVEPGLPRPEREQGMQPSKYDYRVPADRTAAGGLGLPAVATYTPDESASLADFRAGERGSLNPTPATPIRSYAPTARLPMPDDLLPGAMRTELRPPPPVEPLVPVPTPPTPIRSYAPRPVPVLKPIVKPNQALIDKMTKADKATTPPPPKPTPLPTPSQTQIDRNTAKIR
jgi:hypothetical protein